MEKGVQKIVAIVLTGVLFVLSFFVLSPIMISLLSGVILGFAFLPIYEFIQKKVKNKNLAASIVCAIIVLLIIVPLWFLTPVLLKQSVQIFTSTQNMDFVTPLKSIFPSAFVSPDVSLELTNAIHSLVTNLTHSAVSAISDILLSFPTLFLQLLVVLFIFFFVLRDNSELVSYIQSVLPFSKDIEKKIFNSSKDITFSIIYGQILIGIIQGILTGLGFYLLGIPNALFLGVLATILGVIPLIGPALIWVPVAIFSLLNGSIWTTLGVIFIGIVNLLFENSVKPMIISKRTNVHPGVILLGMVGGVFFFGIVGFIIGPLILAYLLIIIEIYRDKKVPGIFIQPPEGNKK